MHNLSDEDFTQQSQNTQPWNHPNEGSSERQKFVQALLVKRAGATFGSACFVAEDARVFTHRFFLGDRSWIASGAIIRGDVTIDSDSSVNAYAHLAGKIIIGRGCRISSLASIYGFNHGFARLDLPIRDQPITSKGVIINEDVWIGANAVILDGVEIGSHSIVAAGAVVTKNFGEYLIIAGNPAQMIGDRRKNAINISTPEPHLKSLPVRSILFERDPYESLERTFPEDLQGWGSDDPLFEKLIRNIRPHLLVEVGTWKGASALHMASICKSLEINAEIVCIDTWLGNWQHWSRSEGVGSKRDLKLVNGFPMLYFQFLSNVIAKRHNDIITPLPLTGVAGAKLFTHYGLRPNLIYIDGDHEYESIILDLRLWLNLVSDDGIVFGDDYEWPGVKKAVSEICAEGQWEAESHGNKFVISRASVG